jgi:hypothetical protein
MKKRTGRTRLRDNADLRAGGPAQPGSLAAGAVCFADLGRCAARGRGPRRGWRGSSVPPERRIRPRRPSPSSTPGIGGLGTALLRELAQRAAEEGIRYFAAEILADNGPMLTPGRPAGGHRDHTLRKHSAAQIDLTKATDQAGTSGYDGYDLLRAAARGELTGLPAVLQGWLDLSEKIIATCWCRSMPSATSPGRPRLRPRHPGDRRTLAITGRMPPPSNQLTGQAPSR